MVLRTRSLCTILAIVVAAGCQRTPDEASTTGATAGTPTTTTATEEPKFDRVALPDMPVLGAQTGWIEGGVVYAAVRAGDAIKALRSLPLPAEVAPGSDDRAPAGDVSCPEPDPPDAAVAASDVAAFPSPPASSFDALAGGPLDPAARVIFGLPLLLD